MDKDSSKVNAGLLFLVVVSCRQRVNVSMEAFRNLMMFVYSEILRERHMLNYSKLKQLEYHQRDSSRDTLPSIEVHVLINELYPNLEALGATSLMFRDNQFQMSAEHFEPYDVILRNKALACISEPAVDEMETFLHSNSLPLSMFSEMTRNQLNESSQSIGTSDLVEPLSEFMGFSVEENSALLQQEVDSASEPPQDEEYTPSGDQHIKSEVSPDEYTVPKEEEEQVELYQYYEENLERLGDMSISFETIPDVAGSPTETYPAEDCDSGYNGPVDELHEKFPAALNNLKTESVHLKDEEVIYDGQYIGQEESISVLDDSYSGPSMNRRLRSSSLFTEEVLSSLNDPQSDWCSQDETAEYESDVDVKVNKSRHSEDRLSRRSTRSSSSARSQSWYGDTGRSEASSRSGYSRRRNRRYDPDTTNLKDVKLLKRVGVPFSYNRVAYSNNDEFRQMRSVSGLTDAQVNAMVDARRRATNRKAAERCRQQKNHERDALADGLVRKLEKKRALERAVAQARHERESIRDLMVYESRTILNCLHDTQRRQPLLHPDSYDFDIDEGKKLVLVKRQTAV